MHTDVGGTHTITYASILKHMDVVIVPFIGIRSYIYTSISIYIYIGALMRLLRLSCLDAFVNVFFSNDILFTKSSF